VRPPRPRRASGVPSQADLAQLQRKVLGLELLHDSAQRLTSLRDLDALLPEVVEQLRRVLGVEIASIMLLDADREELRIAAAAGLPADVVAHARVPIGKGVSGQVAARGEPILVRDLSEHPEFGRSQHASQYTTESLLCAPLRVGERVLGVVNVNNKLTGEPLDDADLAVVVTFAAQAALAIENSRLYGNLEAEVQRVTRALQRSNAELRRITDLTESILRNMSSGLIVADLDGRIVRANPAGAGMLGLETVDGRDALDTVFGTDGARAIGAEDSGPAERREMPVKTPDGREMLLGFSTSPLVDGEGRRAGTVVIFRDLTRLKRMESELVRMDRMASLGVIGAGIAHEIRNPLTAIRFNLDFLAEGGEPSSEIEVIRKNVERLDDLVKKLLRFARPQQPAFETQALAPRAEAVVALIRKQAAAAGVVIETHLGGDVPQVQIDGAQVEQVVLNIALNGIQHMGSGGRLVLASRVRRHRLDGEMYLELAIADEGPGLSEEEARQIFDPFFTTRKEGTGLGLAVAHRIMEDHGGYVEVAPPEDCLSSGATFLIGFPLEHGAR
jgi:two-component system NtrC family sensor kinase